MSHRRALLWATLATLLVLAAQALVVQVSYGGNWTGLFCIGELQKRPAIVSQENAFLFRNAYGYDGQWYHLMAHDPAIVEGTPQYLDAARLRYRRILVPALAWAAALSQDVAIDEAYIGWIAASVFCGVYLLSLLAQGSGLPAMAGLAFLAIPATPISADRLVTDSVLTALTAAFLWLSASPPGIAIWLVCVAAALCRETGILLLFGYLVYLAGHGHWRRAGMMTTAAIPVAGWFAYVQGRTPAYDYGPLLAPAQGLVRALLQPFPYAESVRFRPVIHVFDWVALAGIILAFVLVARWIRWPLGSAGEAAAVLFLLMGLFLQREDHWQQVYDYGRVYSPMLAVLVVEGFRRRSWLLVAPLALMLPRLAIQLSVHVLAAVK